MNKIIHIDKNWKEKQEKALRKLYDLRENSLRNIIILLNNDYARDINKEYMLKIQDKITDLYNELSDIAKYIEYA